MRWLTRNRLNSKEAEVRLEAIEKLAPTAGAREALLFARALQDENPSVRSAAASALRNAIRENDGHAAIQALLPWLKEEDFALRACAANALEMLGWRPSTSEERVLQSVALGNFNCISPNEEATVDILLPLLKVKSESTRFAATQTLEQLNIKDERIIQPLIELLNDPSLPVRVSAAQALINSGDERRIKPLLAKLNNDAPQMRSIAADAIGKTGDSNYLPKIVPLLKDTNFEVRLAAIAALGNFKCPEAYEPIASMLDDCDTDVRKGAIESLARLNEPRAVKVLIPMLIDKESIVRHAAANALQVLSPEWAGTKEARESIPLLEAALKHEEYWVRDAAAKTLKRIWNP